MCIYPVVCSFLSGTGTEERFIHVIILKNDWLEQIEMLVRKQCSVLQVKLILPSMTPGAELENAPGLSLGMTNNWIWVVMKAHRKDLTIFPILSEETLQVRSTWIAPLSISPPMPYPGVHGQSRPKRRMLKT